VKISPSSAANILVGARSDVRRLFIWSFFLRISFDLRRERKFCLGSNLPRLPRVGRRTTSGSAVVGSEEASGLPGGVSLASSFLKNALD